MAEVESLDIFGRVGRNELTDRVLDVGPVIPAQARACQCATDQCQPDDDAAPDSTHDGYFRCATCRSAFEFRHSTVTECVRVSRWQDKSPRRELVTVPRSFENVKTNGQPILAALRKRPGVATDFRTADPGGQYLWITSR